MAGEGSLHGHFGGFQVADFANHDDVRVLPHERAQALGKAEVDGRLHLRLVEGRFDHFDGVFNGADVHFFGGHALEGGIQRGGFAAAGGAGDEDDAVGAGDERLPAGGVVAGKAQGFERLGGRFGVEDAHHQLFAKGGGQG